MASRNPGHWGGEPLTKNMGMYAPYMHGTHDDADHSALLDNCSHLPGTVHAARATCSHTSHRCALTSIKCSSAGVMCRQQDCSTQSMALVCVHCALAAEGPTCPHTHYSCLPLSRAYLTCFYANAARNARAQAAFYDSSHCSLCCLLTTHSRLVCHAPTATCTIDGVTQRGFRGCASHWPSAPM
jgi:hypothetical protein